MLGACRRDPNELARRAPETEAEWEAVPLEECDSGDDEEGHSDAGSLIDDPDCGVPTASDWDPQTKRSRSGPGPRATSQQDRAADRHTTPGRAGSSGVPGPTAAATEPLVQAPQVTAEALQVTAEAGPSRQTELGDRDHPIDVSSPEGAGSDTGSDTDADGEPDMGLGFVVHTSLPDLPRDGQAQAVTQPSVVPTLPQQPPAAPLPTPSVAPAPQSPQSAQPSSALGTPGPSDSFPLNLTVPQVDRPHTPSAAASAAPTAPSAPAGASSAPSNVTPPTVVPPRPMLLAVPRPGAATFRTGARAGPRGREESREPSEPLY
ncbi:hypothetical protein FRC06_010809 [Ceratobasidium sp. 370]|nr:hypothetical protein FRC06_010809 [Ceratobasidium sp. 370]